MRIHLFFLCFLLMLASCSSSGKNTQSAQQENPPGGVPASPGPTAVELPDGSSLTIFVVGNMKVSYTETYDGYTVMRGEDGYYYYAETGSEGLLVIGEVKAHDPGKRFPREQRYLGHIPKHLRHAQEAVEKLEQQQNQPNE